MIREKQNKVSELVIDLTGPDGNAFALIGIAKRLASKLSLDFGTIQKEMTSGDYENLINVFDKAFGDFVILER